MYRKNERLVSSFFKSYPCINITLKYLRCSAWLLPTTSTWKLVAENDVKTDIIRSKRHPGVMHESYLGVLRHFLAPISQAEVPVGYARNDFWVLKQDCLPIIRGKYLVWA